MPGRQDLSTLRTLKDMTTHKTLSEKADEAQAKGDVKSAKLHGGGLVDKVTGKAKQVAGDVTDNKSLSTKGHAQESKGRAKDTAGSVIDKAQSAVDKIRS